MSESVDAIDAATLRATVVPALRKLSRRQREVIVLTHIGGLTMGQPAEEALRPDEDPEHAGRAAQSNSHDRDAPDPSRLDPRRLRARPGVRPGKLDILDGPLPRAADR
ncbi:MAG: hypothetical protein ACRD0Z_14430 [Acidimicrobiales bacterium]